MTNTLITEEYGPSSPELQPLSPTLEKQVAEILEAAEDSGEDAAASPRSLGFTVPMPGVRYYSYI